MYGGERIMIYRDDELIEKVKELLAESENEVVEFKEAKSNYSFKKIGEYFSALSNEATLEAKGFTLGSVTEEESDSPEGTVISQNPVAGTELESSQAVSVVISKGRSVKEVAMPGLLGKSLDSAKAEIESAGLKVGSVTYGYSDDYPSGQVIEQQYSSGTSLEEGTSVGIKVSKGPEPQPDVPDDNEEEEEAE